MFKKSREATNEEVMSVITRGVPKQTMKKPAPKVATPEENFWKGVQVLHENLERNRDDQSIHFLSYLMELCIFDTDTFGSSAQEWTNKPHIESAVGDHARTFVEELVYTTTVAGNYGGNLLNAYRAANNNDSLIDLMLRDERFYRTVFLEIDSEGLGRLIRLAGTLTRMKLVAYYQLYEKFLAVADFKISMEINDAFVKGGEANLAKVHAAMEPNTLPSTST
jgi:hypothetical protein